MAETVSKTDHPVYVGIDVQVRRPCAMVALDHNLRMVDSAWLAGTSATEVCDDLCGRFKRLGDGGDRRAPPTTPREASLLVGSEMLGFGLVP